MTKLGNNLVWKGLLDVPWFCALLKAPALQAEASTRRGYWSQAQTNFSKRKHGTISPSLRKQVQELFTFSPLCVVKVCGGSS